MISVIVPNLNEAAYLKKFLLSLESQSFKDFEVIIIDGGSTDGSREIVDAFEKKYPHMRIVKLIDTRRNIGAVRNRGAQAARGDLLFHTSSDVMFDPWVFWEVMQHFNENSNLICLTARTKPVCDKALSHLAYQCFDFLRWVFTYLPGSIRKFRPGGNFFVIKKWAFEKVGGFPEVCINEDGLLGQKVDELLLGSNLKVSFDLGMCVHHHVKRFEKKGSVKTILFYVYVFGNMFPFMKPFFYRIEQHSAEIFKNRSDLRDFDH